MTKTDLTKRYIMYLVGLYVLAMGLALIICSGLGTSPISSWAYVMSNNTPASVGTYTVIINTMMIFGQCFVLHHHGLKSQWLNILLQLPCSFLFGAFIDLNIMLLRQGFLPLFEPVSGSGAVGAYAVSMFVLLLGVVVQSYGVLIEVKPQVTMMSAEALVYYISERWDKEFGRIKVGFDCYLVFMAVVFSLIFKLTPDHISDVGFRQALADGILGGVREGTIIAALAVGRLVRVFSKHSSWLDRILSAK